MIHALSKKTPITIKLTDEDRRNLIWLLNEIVTDYQHWGDNTVLGVEFQLDYEHLRAARRLLKQLK